MSRSLTVIDLHQQTIVLPKSVTPSRVEENFKGAHNYVSFPSTGYNSEISSVPST